MTDATKLIVVGGLCLIGGVMALANPFAASIATEIFIGWTFLFSGVVGLVAVFNLEQNRVFAAIFAIVMIAIGVFLVANPIPGLLAITVAIAMMLVISGVTRIMMSLSMRDHPGFWIFLLSGAMSFLLGLALFANFPQAAEKVLGLFLGIELILTAVTLLFMGRKLRQT